jgi:3-deoxy-D-manno-octulosonic-acid transferase
MWFIYQVALILVLLSAAPVLILRRGTHHLKTLRGRLGRGPVEDPAPGAQLLWIHAVSVGEVSVARVLLEGLRPEVPVLITTVTPTGQSLARSLQRSRPTLRVAYLPLDTGWTLRRFVEREDPRALVLVESEYWPYLQRLMQRQGRPVYVVNARVSDRTYRRLRGLRRWAPSLLRPLLGPIARFCAQSPEDAQRLLELGAPAERVVVTGNLKFEQRLPRENALLSAQTVALAGGRPILVAGSTMPGEDEQLLSMLATLRAQGQPLLLVLAPRHPERWDSVAETVRQNGLTLVRRSEMPQADGREDSAAAVAPAGNDAGPLPEVLLLDSIGELAAIYRHADLAFVGGTLVPTGGHNPLEPALYGRPLIVGPSMENFRQIAEIFQSRKAWRQVPDGDGLTAAVIEWLAEPALAREHGDRAAELMQDGLGARQRTFAEIPVLQDAALGA